MSLTYDTPISFTMSTMTILAGELHKPSLVVNLCGSMVAVGISQWDALALQQHLWRKNKKHTEMHQMNQRLSLSHLITMQMPTAPANCLLGYSSQPAAAAAATQLSILSVTAAAIYHQPLYSNPPTCHKHTICYTKLIKHF